MNDMSSSFEGKMKTRIFSNNFIKLFIVKSNNNFYIKIKSKIIHIYYFKKKDI